MRQLKFFLLFSFSLSSQPILAADGFTADFALFYMTDNSSRSVSNSIGDGVTIKNKTTYTFSALGFCYRYDVYCFGLKYLQGSVEDRTSSSEDGSSFISTETFHGPGLTLGYSGTELIAHLTLLVGAEKTVGDKAVSSSGNSIEASTRYPAKAARVLDLGYGFKLGSVRVGPMLSILHMEYRDMIKSGKKTALAAKESDDFIMPHFALWMDF